MTLDFQLLVNGEERTPPVAGVDSAAEWDATWEERVDGVGTASVTIQDRNNDPELNYGRKRDIIEFGLPGLYGGFDHLERSFYGEITRARIDLPPGRPWRKWKISASDFNTVMDLRLVGVPDGYSWITIDGGATHTAVDPDAFGRISDRATVQHLFNAYSRFPAGAGYAGGGNQFQISYFVFNYIPRNLLWNRATSSSRLLWTNTTLRAALDELRGLAPFPIFCWIDPGGLVHWEAFKDPFISPGTLPGMFPHRRLRAAPAIIVDSDPDGVTSIGGRDLSFEYDGTYMPERAYISGVTDFIYNSGSTRFQGTGWRRRATQDITRRQLLADAQSITEAQRDAVAGHYQKFAARARIKGSVTVGQPGEAIDGWRCGQYVTIYDARLPAALNGRAWPILAVKGSLKAGHSFRVYTLEFGDAPIERFSQKYRTSPQRLPTARLPAKQHRVLFPTTHLRPSTDYVLHSQMVDHSQKPIRQGGVPVLWSLTVRNREGAIVATGSLTVHTSLTDHHGRTAATLATGSATDLHYHVTAITSRQ